MLKYEQDYINTQKNNGDNTYYKVRVYEVETNENLEFEKECYSLELFKNDRDERGWPKEKEIQIKSLNFIGFDLEKEITDKFTNEIFELVGKGVRKINNGYIYNDNYYKTLEEVKKEIEDENE